MKTLLLATAGGIALFAGVAQAADVSPVVVPPVVAPVVSMAPADHSGPYISLFGGLMFTPDVTVTAVFYVPTFDVNIARGLRVGGALGYNLNDTLGVEAEVSHGGADLDGVSLLDGTPIPNLPAEDSSASFLSIMGNVTIGHWFGSFRPYVAAGVGGVTLSLDIPNDAIGPDGVDGHDWTRSVQVLVGADFALSDNITIGARYRFQHIGATNFVDAGNSPVALDAFNVQSVEAVLSLHF